MNWSNSGIAYATGARKFERLLAPYWISSRGHPIVYSYRHFPDLASDQSLLAAVATEAARRQGKFWPMYSALFTQPLINCASLIGLASALELEQIQFLHDLLDDQLYNQIKTDWRLGHLSGVRSSPTLFIGGQQFHGKLTQARLAPIIQFHLNHFRPSVLNVVDQKGGLVHWSRNEFG
ncbi:DsbA family protein [Spirosoma foliorum]|uniref:Thioredoxin domain-containing protein n=1 Tax=Spirosoma foliorum TaxID=2710596 RepID=A0A7G5H174_9BACT|nr:thioredoxin domain-containing protein [Spirosoma foliorum]QMW04866.1 thioredoxin domain-containing protein [Spirosoma foliorum]